MVMVDPPRRLPAPRRSVMNDPTRLNQLMPPCSKNLRSSIASTESTITLGDLVIGQNLALGAVLSLEERGDQLGFQFVGVQRLAWIRAHAENAIDSSIGAGQNLGSIGRMIGLCAGVNLDAARDHPEVAHRRVGPIVSVDVGGAPQHGGDLRRREPVSWMHRNRTRIDLCRSRKDLPAHPFGDDAIVPNVIESKDSEAAQREDEEDGDRSAKQ